MFSLAFLFLLAFATHNAAAALVNATIDDQNFSLISYAPSNRWNHEPLLGWEDDFHNRSRSFTYSRAAIATFVFTGTSSKPSSLIVHPYTSPRFCNLGSWSLCPRPGSAAHFSRRRRPGYIQRARAREESFTALLEQKRSRLHNAYARNHS